MKFEPLCEPPSFIHQWYLPNYRRRNGNWRLLSLFLNSCEVFFRFSGPAMKRLAWLMCLQNFTGCNLKRKINHYFLLVSPQKSLALRKKTQTLRRVFPIDILLPLKVKNLQWLPLAAGGLHYRCPCWVALPVVSQNKNAANKNIQINTVDEGSKTKLFFTGFTEQCDRITQNSVIEFAFLEQWGKCSFYLHSSKSSMSFGYYFLFASVVPLMLLSSCFATLNI